MLFVTFERRVCCVEVEHLPVAVHLFVSIMFFIVSMGWFWVSSQDSACILKTEGSQAGKTNTPSTNSSVLLLWLLGGSWYMYHSCSCRSELQAA